MFKKIFIDLCNAKNESPSAVCRSLGLAPATFSCWTDDSVPRRATLQKIAQYFNVSVDYLLGKEEKKPSMPEGTEGMGENEKRLFAIWDQVPEEQKPELLNLIEAALRMHGER